MSFIRHSDPRDQSDQDLLQQYRQKGDLEVLAQLYQRYMDLVYAVCLKYLKTPDAGKDAVMQLFEELSIKLKQHEVTHFKSWLHTVARNYCLMQLRSPRNLKTVSIEGAFMQLEENGHLVSADGKEEKLNQMEKCLELLPDEQKQAVSLFYLEGRSYKEIAVITGIEWNSVRSHIQNGRRNLKLCIEKSVAARQVAK